MPKMGPDGQGLNYPGRKNVVVLIEREGNYDIEFCWWGDRTLHAAYVLNPPGVPIAVTITAWPVLALHVIVDEINDQLLPLTVGITDTNIAIVAGNTVRSVIIATVPPAYGRWNMTLYIRFEDGGTGAILTKVKCAAMRSTTFPAGAIPVPQEQTVNLSDDELICLYGSTLRVAENGPAANCRGVYLEFEQDAIYASDTTVNYAILWSSVAA